MKNTLIILILLPMMSVAANLNQEVKSGAELYIAGKLDLSRYLLEHALEKYEKDNKRSELSRSHVLTKRNYQSAIEHLFPLYFELRDFMSLRRHVKKYGSMESSSDIGEYGSVKRGDLWTCRTLDFQEYFIRASECWNKAGRMKERNTSIRASEVVSAFGGARKIMTSD